MIQVRAEDVDAVLGMLKTHGLDSATSRIGTLNDTRTFRIRQGGQVLLEENLFALRAVWSDVTHRIASLRDNPACAESEHQFRLDPTDPGITPKVTFPYPLPARISKVAQPPIAILREQGVNGEVEMAAAFSRAGFRAVDVHMTDLLAGRVSLRDFRGLAACGGFSYGDVLGAGEGWAKSILFHEQVRAEFAAFFAREDTFALGVCNGCQMISNLKGIIPGAGHWPRFVQNQSERYEGRFVSVRIEPSPSLLFAGMEGSVLPIAVAHGEGYAEFPDTAAMRACSASGLVAARFVDHKQALALAQSSIAQRPREGPIYTEQYPLNPNSSPLGMTAFTTTSGRVTIMMPHPERVFRSVAMSWAPSTWGEDSPWMKLFDNARAWVG